MDGMHRLQAPCACGCGRPVWVSSPDSLGPGKSIRNDCRRRITDARTCKQCGRSLAGKPRKAKFCTTTCANVHRREADPTCVVCKAAFPYDRDHSQKRHCSSECVAVDRTTKALLRRLTRPPRPPTPPKPKSPRPIFARTRRCAECSRTFWSNRNSKYCTDDCAHAAKVAYDLNYNRTQRPRNNSSAVHYGHCIDCGLLFTSKHARKYCSRVCRKSAHRRMRAYRKRGAVKQDPYSRHDIYERDDWRCGICHKKTRRDKQVPHPQAPTLDHIIPLSVGGADAPVNLQTACFMCNSLKGASAVGSQLRLVG